MKINYKYFSKDQNSIFGRDKLTQALPYFTDFPQIKLSIIMTIDSNKN
jgi:hypothetical protein